MASTTSRVALVLALVAACGGGDDGTTLAHPWHDGSAGDATCSAGGCTELAAIHDPHLGDVKVLGVDGADDPYAQYGGCIISTMQCHTAGRDLAECVAASTCPAPCRAEYERQLAGATDAAAEIETFTAVFLAEGAPCGEPPQEVAP